MKDFKDMTVGEYRELPEEEQHKVEHKVSTELFFRLAKDRAVQAIDILEGLGINDYENGYSRTEIPLGIAWGCIKALKISLDEQARAEMQVHTERTDYGSQLAAHSSDITDTLYKCIEELIATQCEYFSVLSNRKAKRHLLNDEGETIPYTAEELMREKLMLQEYAQEK